jgi:hypothetical protein
VAMRPLSLPAHEEPGLGVQRAAPRLGRHGHVAST